MTLAYVIIFRMASIFTKIVHGEIPCHKIGEDKDHFAFLEISPVAEGHTLVIPKNEVDYLFDMEDKTLGELMVFSKKVAQAIKAAIPCQKIAVLVYGLQVRHAHVHLIPVQGVSGELNLSHAKKADDKALAAIAEKIRTHYCR